MDFKYLSELLYPDVTMTPEDVERMYPPRVLPEGAKVTRFAPSPTGFVHLGGMYQSMIGERLAHQSGGVVFLRIEDTDSQREVKGATESIIRILSRYGVEFDEGVSLNQDGSICNRGDYGPYIQSKRKDIYHVFAKKLVSEGKAYPVFTTKEEFEKLSATDKRKAIKDKDWHAVDKNEQQKQQEKQREFTIDEVKLHLDNGDPFVLRLLADGDPEKKTNFTDLIKGTLEVPENDEDFVLLKSDGIPTYHFAHAVDDHLMHTTHVIRGEDWLPSVAKHIALFRCLGFKPPKYLHTAQIMHFDENGNKKKLSKRDMGFNMNDYRRMGYAPECVCEYLMTLLNSNYEEWHAANSNLPYTDFPFSIKKMSNSGCLFDFDKFNDVSRNIISRMDAEKVYNYVCDWAAEFDPDFASMLSYDKDYSVAMLAIGRSGKKPRKDIARWDEIKDFYSYFFDNLYTVSVTIDGNHQACDIKRALNYFADVYDAADDNNGWFEKVKAASDCIGYCNDMKLYKQTPELYRGNVADVSSFIRVAITGRLNSPDLCEIMKVLGYERSVKRLREFADKL